MKRVPIYECWFKNRTWWVPTLKEAHAVRVRHKKDFVPVLTITRSEVSLPKNRQELCDSKNDQGLSPWVTIWEEPNP